MKNDLLLRISSAQMLAYITDMESNETGPRMPLPWPIFTIDFEASGLGEFTYPIEIGVACWRSRHADIEIWSTLIRPTDNWRQHRIWNPTSEKVHGITRDQLEQGASPSDALDRANRLIGCHFAFCDGGEHDLRWLYHLAHAAGFQPSFQLADWATLGGALSPPQHMRMIRWLETQSVSHRGGEDAERLLRALAFGLETKSGEAGETVKG